MLKFKDKLVMILLKWIVMICVAVWVVLFYLLLPLWSFILMIAFAFIGYQIHRADVYYDSLTDEQKEIKNQL